MAAAAAQDGAPRAPLRTKHLLRFAWACAALGLIAVAVWLGTHNDDGRMGATLPIKEGVVQTLPVKWQLAIDGVTVQPAATGNAKQLRASGPIKQASTAKKVPATGDSVGSAESRLFAVYEHMRLGERARALALAESLSNDYPNFQLGQLLYADLLAVSSNKPINLSTLSPKTGTVSTNLKVLLEESRLRLQAITEVPAPGLLPANLLRLPKTTQNLIAVDTSRSRLYWFVNRAKPGEAVDLVLEKDLYITVGKNGVLKQVEGDGRTPLGVYFVSSKLPGEDLPDLYGRGALPINYPNALDILRGKTGSGIWLHGTPAAQYVRAPLASDGCVVMANPDISTLMSQAGIIGTPVVIAPSIDWVARDSLTEPRDRFRAVFDQWVALRANGDLGALRSTYSDTFFRRGKNLAHWWPTLKSEAVATVKISDLSIIHWKDDDDVMVVNYLEQITPRGKLTRKRQYWRLEAGNWKIFYEGNA